ncbi:hypothetical protein [Stenotrophomonas nitritireducens]|uniref:hypothetical protein n=1 Tax=Stenotrophomonas nitritireducens TaxID=83617 RepID=UPI003D951CEA
MTKDHRISIDQSILILGQGHFVRSVAIPLSEEMEELASIFDDTDEDDHFEISARSTPQAFLTELGGLAAVGVFLGTWAAKTALDEIYKAAIRPRIIKVIENFVNESQDGKYYSTAISAKSRSDKNTILVISIGRTIEEIESCNDLVPEAFEIGISEIAAHPDGTIRSYVIEDGVIRFGGCYRSRLAALNALAKAMTPIGPIRSIRNDS